jgi:hypothetical protein
MPVYNEAEHVAHTLASLVAHLDEAAWPAEVIVVDDGSTDGTSERLRAVSQNDPRIRVVRTANMGRFLARAAGLDLATAPVSLLLDARVTLARGALAFVAEQVETSHRAVWNADVTIDTKGNPFAGFWSVIVRLGWRRYFADRRLTSFGLDDFDSYPKGTGCFLAPTELLRDAVADYQPDVADVRLSSDDTRLLRFIAAKTQIYISPDFMCVYVSRDSLSKFLGHAYFRGSTFVDGYLRSSGPVGRLFRAGLAVGPVLVLVGAICAHRAPRAAAVAVAGTAAATSGVATRLGAKPREIMAFLTLLPAFAAAFGAGVVRGLRTARASTVGIPRDGEARPLERPRGRRDPA